MSKAKYVCQCFFYKNYFLKKYKLHTEYLGDEVINDATKQVLLGCGATDEDLNDVLISLSKERKRREDSESEGLKRKEVIKLMYKPLHSHLYKLQKEFLDPSFLAIVAYARSPSATQKGLVALLEPMSCAEVWRFPVFNRQFCSEFIEELTSIENSSISKGRPNTMNRYGILLNEWGFDDFFLTTLRDEFLSPIAKLLLPQWFGNGLDSHKAFTVQYKANEDLELAYHYDNSEITLNVCLGKEFEDGDLYFGNRRKDPVDLSMVTRVRHRLGHGVLHCGEHRHGAMPISGKKSQRYNLILWMRSSTVRNKLCPMCGCKPTLVETVYGGDGFVPEKQAACEIY